MEPFLGEIRCFAFGQHIPRFWVACQGQLLSLNANVALFTLLGTQFGGDGKTNFGLPDLQGRVPVHMSFGRVGAAALVPGSKGGTETVTLLAAELPPHSHPVQTNSAPGTAVSPQGGYLAGLNAPHLTFGANAGLVPMASDVVGMEGRGAAHSNMQPFLVVGFYIATMGLYPTRA